MAHTFWIYTFIMMEGLYYFSLYQESFPQKKSHNITQTWSILIENASFEDVWQWYNKSNHFIISKLFFSVIICIITERCIWFCWRTKMHTSQILGCFAMQSCIIFIIRLFVIARIFFIILLFYYRYISWDRSFWGIFFISRFLKYGVVTILLEPVSLDNEDPSSLFASSRSIGGTGMQAIIVDLW